uniref:Uncharacterized protein n=1 Tax=Anopheles coluzzii TaxID=1518534 RepID=A0A8W7PSV9_ANOCL
MKISFLQLALCIPDTRCTRRNTSNTESQHAQSYNVVEPIQEHPAMVQLLHGAIVVHHQPGRRLEPAELLHLLLRHEQRLGRHDPRHRLQAGRCRQAALVRKVRPLDIPDHLVQRERVDELDRVLAVRLDDVAQEPGPGVQLLVHRMVVDLVEQPDHRNAVDLFAGRRERLVQPVVEHQVDLHRVPLVVVHVLRPDRTVDAPVEVELIEQVLGFQRAPAQHRPISAGAPVVGLPVEPERSLAVHQQGAARVEQDGALVAATAPRIHPVPEKLPAAGAGRARCRSSAGSGSFASARSASGSAGK